MLGNAEEIKKTLFNMYLYRKTVKIKWYNTKNTFLKVND
jgi:hypothetical protein